MKTKPPYGPADGDSEAGFRDLLDAANDLIFILSPDARFLYSNRAFQGALGYSEPELRALDIFDLLHPSCLEVCQQHFQGLTRQAQPQTFETEFVTKDGRTITVEGNCNSGGQNGKPGVIRGIFRDVTERKRAEAALRKSESNYRTLIESASDGILVSDAQGRLLDVNAAGCRMFSYTREELLTMSNTEIIASTEVARIAPEMASLSAGEVVRSEWQLRRKDGSLFPGEIGATILPDGRLLGILRDITERKRAEAAVSEAEARLRLSVTASNIGLWDWNLLTNEVYFSREWKGQLGYAEDEIPNRFEEWQSRLHPDDVLPTLAKVRRFIEDPTAEYAVEFRLRHKDGSYRWIFTQAQVFRDASNKPVRMMGCHIDITERKQAEEARQASEARYRKLFEYAPDGILIADPEGNYIDANASMCRMLGYTRNELIGLHASDIVAETEIQHIEPAFSAVKAKSDYHREWQFRRRDGSVFATEVIATLMPDGNLLGMIRDITERKQAEAALREREEQLRLFIEHSPAAIAMLDRNMCYLVASHRWLTDYRLHEQDVIGRSHYEIFPEIPERWKEIHRRCLGGAVEKSDADEFPRADGSTDWLRWEIRPWHTAQGDIGGLIIFSEVITERKRAEAALRESEGRYRTLFETAPDGIAVFDAQMKIMMTNHRAVEIYGYDNAAEMIGMSAYDLIAPELRPRARENARRTVEEGGFEQIESTGLKKDGTEFAVESSATLIRDPQGKPMAILGVTRDVTERKQAEEQLRASEEQLRALSARLQAAREEEGTRIAREIHDELGGALTGLKWDLEGIDKVLSGAGNSGKVGTVREKIPNMTGLIESTINIVRRISSELRPGVLDDLGLVVAIEWQTGQFQTRTGIKCECIAGVHAVDLSRERATAVFRIFQEILTNVLRHSQATRVDIELTEHDGQLELRVSDNGRGITEEEMRDTRSLGLLGMRERALLVGGEVSISGVAGLGTTVTARVPTS